MDFSEILAKPREVCTDWIELPKAWEHYYPLPEHKPNESDDDKKSIAQKRKSLSDIKAEFEGAAIRVKRMTDGELGEVEALQQMQGQALRDVEEAKKVGDIEKEMDAASRAARYELRYNEKVLRYGLHSVNHRNLDEPKQPDKEDALALAHAPYAWFLAMVVRDAQVLTPEIKAAFFGEPSAASQE